MAAPALRPAPPPFLGYGRQLIEEDDIAAVVAALRSDHLAHGPRVDAFERALAASCGAREAVACSSGTAALQLALSALDVGPQDVCVVPALTFLSTATAARLLGAEVRFADVDADTGLMTAETLAEALGGGGVKAVLPVHLAGRLCEMEALSLLARAVGAAVVEDACHAIGGRDAVGRPVGACATSDAACFSFHPVKTIAAGEGGAVSLNDPDRAARMRRLRNHGVTREPGRLREAGSFGEDGAPEPWAYEQRELGFNLRLDEMSAALGFSQLAKLERFVAVRTHLADTYDATLAPLAPRVRPTPRGSAGARPGLHLYTVLLDDPDLAARRGAIMRALAADGIGTQVHYVPLHRQPYFRDRYGEMRLPGSEAYYARVLALPLHPSMDDRDIERVTDALARAIA